VKLTPDQIAKLIKDFIGLLLDDQGESERMKIYKLIHSYCDNILFFDALAARWESLPEADRRAIEAEVRSRHPEADRSTISFYCLSSLAEKGAEL
jgi:hypothetical protein